MASLFTWCESIRLFPWDLVETKVNQSRAREPFSSQEELKMKIKAVRKDCAIDLKPLRKAIKQFFPRLRAVEEKQGYCIKWYLVDWIIYTGIVKL